jgi:DNA-binding MarR family transcriptional regulator
VGCHGGLELGAGASPTGRGSLQKGEEDESPDDRVLEPAGAGGPTLGKKRQRSERHGHDPTFRGDGPKAPSHPSGTKPGLASDDRSRSHRSIIAPAPTGDRSFRRGQTWKETAPLDRITYCPIYRLYVNLTIIRRVEVEGWEVEPNGDWPLPALLRGARAAFGAAIRHGLAEAGCDDLPPNGPYVLGAIARTGAPLAVVIRQLGVSKQTAGQLVDSLVVRGYLSREVDPEDRRRLVVRLTDRGEAAASLIRSVVETVEAELQETVGARRLRHTRETLAAMIRIGWDHE